VEAGHEVGEQEYKQYEQFAESEDYTANFDQTSHIQMMATHMIDALLPALAERHWSLGIATDDAPNLICSDMPVGVFPARGSDIGKPMSLFSPATVLSFPINRRLVALARYERRGDVQEVTAPGVRLINYWTISGARQVFSSAPDFSFMTPDGTICGKGELVALLRSAGRVNRPEGKKKRGHSLPRPCWRSPVRIRVTIQSRSAKWPTLHDRTAGAGGVLFRYEFDEICVVLSTFSKAFSLP
jgi:hypothetical protein